MNGFDMEQACRKGHRTCAKDQLPKQHVIKVKKSRVRARDSTRQLPFFRRFQLKGKQFSFGQSGLQD